MKCPHCQDTTFNGQHCRFCGCRATANPASGNIVFMIRGRVVAAPDDLREQMAKQRAHYGIKGPDPMNPSNEDNDGNR